MGSAGPAVAGAWAGGIPTLTLTGRGERMRAAICSTASRGRRIAGVGRAETPRTLAPKESMMRGARAL